jgi:hypothetical protein
LFGRKELSLAVESETGTKVNLPNNIKEIMQGDFSFLEGGRIVGDAGEKGEKGAVLKFPSGEVVYSNLNLGMAYIDGASKGDFALVHPLKDFAAGVFDLKQNKFIIGSKRTAIDIYDGEYIRERLDGELATFDLNKKTELKKVDLKDGPLGRITAADASSDLNYVALSGTVRGAVWNLKKGTRVAHLRRFNSVTVDDAGFALADFPKEGDAKRQFAKIDTTTNEADSFEAEADSEMTLAGAYLIVRTSTKKSKSKKDVNLVIKNARTNTELWRRNFPDGAPRFFVSPENSSLVFTYDVSDVNGKAALQASEELRRRVQALKTREEADLVESIDLKTGKTVAITPIDTGKGSFSLRDAFFVGQKLVIVDTRDRVQILDFAGSREGRFQAQAAFGSNDAKLLVADIGRGKLAVFDLEKFKQVEELDFASRVSMVRFAKSSDRLLVVTRDQKAYYFDTKQLLAGQQVASAK